MRHLSLPDPEVVHGPHTRRSHQTLLRSSQGFPCPSELDTDPQVEVRAPPRPTLSVSLTRQTLPPLWSKKSLLPSKISNCLQALPHELPSHQPPDPCTTPCHLPVISAAASAEPCGLAGLCDLIVLKVSVHDTPHCVKSERQQAGSSASPLFPHLP